MIKSLAIEDLKTFHVHKILVKGILKKRFYTLDSGKLKEIK